MDNSKNQFDNEPVDIMKIYRNIRSKLKGINPSDIPNIDLYMDQVTTFMDEHLTYYKRKEEDKILTKTMINNYAKANLMPSPEKKKYSKDHLALMIMIYYLKNVLSISDITTLMENVTDKHFNNQEGPNLVDIYSYLYTSSPKVADRVDKDIEKICNIVDNQIADNEAIAESRDFMILADLAVDITLKKRLLEEYIDRLAEKKEAALEEEKKQKEEAERLLKEIEKSNKKSAKKGTV